MSFINIYILILGHIDISSISIDIRLRLRELFSYGVRLYFRFAIYILFIIVSFKKVCKLILHWRCFNNFIVDAGGRTSRLSRRWRTETAWLLIRINKQVLLSVIIAIH